MLPASEAVGMTTSQQEVVKIQREIQLEERVLHDGWKKEGVEDMKENKTKKKTQHKNRRETVFIFVSKILYLYIYAHVNSFMLCIYGLFIWEKSVLLCLLCHHQDKGRSSCWSCITCFAIGNVNTIIHAL